MSVPFHIYRLFDLFIRECLDLKVKVDLLGQLGLKVPRDNKGNQEEKGHLDNKEE